MQGRSGTVSADRLSERTEGFTNGVEHAAVGPFRGYAIRDELLDAVAVLDAFHVVRLGTAVVDQVRRCVQQTTLHRRGHRDDPLYKIRRLLRHGAEHLTDKQRARRDARLSGGDLDYEVALAGPCCWLLRSAYTTTNPATGRTA